MRLLDADATPGARMGRLTPSLARRLDADHLLVRDSCTRHYLKREERVL